MQEFNLAHQGKAYVLSSQSGTHFMNGEVLSIMQEQLWSQAFHLQRAKPTNISFGL